MRECYVESFSFHLLEAHERLPHLDGRLPLEKKKDNVIDIYKVSQQNTEIRQESSESTTEEKKQMKYESRQWINDLISSSD